MDLWISHSSTGKQTMLSVACVLAGIVLAIGFREFATFKSNAAAGFGLGLLLLVIGLAGFLANGKQTVIVDPKARRIVIEDSTLLATKKRLIPFNEVVGVSIGYLGKRSNFVTWYYLVLKLNSGGEYPLFAPGRFFEGGAERSTVMRWKQRLEEYLSQ